MADSLLFDGTDDVIELTGGVFDASPPDAFSAFAVFKRGSLTTFDGVGYIGEVGTGSKAGFSIRNTDELLSDTNVIGGQGETEGAGSVGDTGTSITSTTQWFLAGYTKPAGASVQPRFHRWNYSLETWGHDPGIPDQNGCSGTLDRGLIGAWLDSGGPNDYFHGNILLVAFWASDLGGDANVESAFTTAIGDALLLQTFFDLAPDELIRCDSLASLSSLTGEMTETSRNGTSVDTGDVPSGWDDTLSGGPAAYPVIAVDQSQHPKPKLAGRTAV